jgi:hypothetical protein
MREFINFLKIRKMNDSTIPIFQYLFKSFIKKKETNMAKMIYEHLKNFDIEHSLLEYKIMKLVKEKKDDLVLEKVGRFNICLSSFYIKLLKEYTCNSVTFLNFFFLFSLKKDFIFNSFYSNLFLIAFSKENVSIHVGFVLNLI